MLGSRAFSAVRSVKLMAVALVVACALVSGALYLLQGRLIYPAPGYPPGLLQRLPDGLVALSDPARRESIVGFYRAPSGGRVPHDVWLVFPGNGDLALNWDAVAQAASAEGLGFLLVEYPGYGLHAGEPSPEALLRGAEHSVQALATHLGLPAQELRARSSALGFSLGAAAALQYAAAHPVKRIVLLAPFTSMLEMARGIVGAPLYHLLVHRYDNTARLREIARSGSPSVLIFHGERDTVIPPRMGAKLAQQLPGATFRLVPAAGHGDLTAALGDRLLQALAEPSR